MSNTTPISRMSKNLKSEAEKANDMIQLDGYTVTGLNTIICDDDNDGSFYGILHYRNGEEVIAVPDFYIDEENVTLTGSKGNEYTLNIETLTRN
jgi:hypothetical protein